MWKIHTFLLNLPIFTSRNCKKYYYFALYIRLCVVNSKKLVGYSRDRMGMGITLNSRSPNSSQRVWANIKSQYYLLRTWSYPQQFFIPQFHIGDEHHWSLIQVEGTPNVPLALFYPRRGRFIHELSFTSMSRLVMSHNKESQWMSWCYPNLSYTLLLPIMKSF